MIVDTDVLIWYSKGNSQAIKAIHSSEQLSISVVNYMEIVQGVRNRKELNAFKKALEVLNIKIIQIDELISTKSLFFVEKYSLSHSLELADALIGATAIIKNEPLLTGNDKHYKHLPDIKLKKFRA